MMIAIALALIRHGADPNVSGVANYTVLDRVIATAQDQAAEAPAMIRFWDALVSHGARTNGRPLPKLLSGCGPSTASALEEFVRHLVVWHNEDPQVRSFLVLV